MNKSFFKVIDSVIVFNCKILNLEQPTVTYEPPNKFATPTTKAGINPDKNVIAINIDTVWESPVEIWWVISHEMRQHLWQVKNGQFNVDNYNPSQENNLKSYAMQFEEVDANAWGVYVIISLFHTRSFMQSKYREIRSNFIDYDKNIMYIDAWRTTNSNEEGKVIAKINLSNSEVEYVDEKAKTDAYAQTVIRRVLNAVV